MLLSVDEMLLPFIYETTDMLRSSYPNSAGALVRYIPSLLLLQYVLP